MRILDVSKFICSLCLINVASLQNVLGPNRFTSGVRCFSRIGMIPTDRLIDADELEILRLLGKIDIVVDEVALQDARQGVKSLRNEMKRIRGDHDPLEEDSILFQTKNGRATSTRVFEARTSNNLKCYLKEFFPLGASLGQRELKTCRKLTKEYNDLVQLRADEKTKPIDELLKLSKGKLLSNEVIQHNKFVQSWKNIDRLPLPQLLGTLIAGDEVRSPLFLAKWAKEFPRAVPPSVGNIWLVYLWDDASFKSIKKFPSLPQTVQVLDYFREDERIRKRWQFIRKIVQKSLQSIDFLHRHGFVHNYICSDSLLMTTFKQEEISKLSVQVTDLGLCQRLSEFSSEGQREAISEDLYQLGFVFIELIVSSFSDDNKGADLAREWLTGKESITRQLVYRVEDADTTQLNQREWQDIFERICSADCRSFRDFVRSIKPWQLAVSMLEADSGAAWRLLFRMLARENLVDEITGKKVKVSARNLLREFSDDLFYNLEQI